MNKYALLQRRNLCSFIIVLCLLTAQHADAQQNEKTNRDNLFHKYATKTIQDFTSTRPYYIIAWEEAVPPGVKVIRQLDGRTAIIELKNQQALELLKQQVRIAEAIDEWKFSPSTEQQITKDNKEQQFILSSPDTDILFNLLHDLKDDLKIISPNSPSHSIIVKTTPKFIRDKLLSMKEVIFIDVRAEPHPEISIIGYDRSFDELNTVDYSIPNANGKNIAVGVKEQKMDETDLDLYKRVLVSPTASANITSHATTVSSIIGGAGNRFYDGRGIAYGCKFFTSSFDNLFADDTTVLNTNNVTVQNHSYGTIVQQFYGAEAVSYDVQTWKNKNIVHVFSAGNEGASFATEGRYANIAGYANITGNFKMAKNVITVGAIDNKENIPAGSSAGPLYDGRLAPQLIALGPSGTSDAAAVVSGTIAVMQQVYKDSNNESLPDASLIKAVLYNTADDVYRAGIDYKTGYGLVNSFAAIKSLQQREYDGGALTQGGVWIKTITIPANAAQLKITLAWTDTAASVNNNKALINDLDLEVLELNTGIVYKPWVLNAAAHTDSLSELPTRKRDSLNSAEQVSVQLPVAGSYQIKITGTVVNTASLPFHIAYHIDTLNTFVFTNPLQASDLAITDANVFIRWKTFIADTNQTSNLYISYNNGINWQLIKQSLKIYTKKYLWQIKDTNSIAVLKMETPFGNFFSNDFVISKVVNPSVDFVCADSFRLSWNKHVYADAYKIYTLTDSPYLKHILTVNDTFIVLRRSVYPQLVYAVQPVLNNNLPAARSIALNIESQGVKCFYKTLYYNLFTGNELELVLELSGINYVDSIFFEQVTSDGQMLQTYSGTKASSEIFKYRVNGVPEGTSYWRAKIKLKNGTIIYTEIISVLTTGKKYILFYPNPASRNSMLYYTLQQDLPFDSKLQLFDITGRLIKSYSEMPNVINLRNIAPGILIYKLFSSDNKLLEIGKVVVL